MADNSTQNEPERHEATVNGPTSPDPKVSAHPIAFVSPGRPSFLFQPTMIPYHASHQGYTSLAAPCLTQASVFYSTHYMPTSHVGVNVQQGSYAPGVPPLLHMQANSSRPTVVQMPTEELHSKSSIESEQSEVELSSRHSRSSVCSGDDLYVKPEDTSPVQSVDIFDGSPPATPSSSAPSPTAKPPLSPQSPSFRTNKQHSPQINDFCGICGDKATGHHYGVSSCEGCKGFFKRSVQNKKVYTCRNLTKDCPMDKRHRNRCQYCRFQKCLNAGMVKEAVREDRAPGGRHKNSISPNANIKSDEPVPCKQPRKSLASISVSNPPDSVAPKPLPEVIKQVLECEYKTIFDENTCPGCKETELKEKTLAHITQLAEQQVIRSSYWFENLPLLQNISQLDKDALIKNSWVELMLANMIKESQELDDRAMLCQKQVLDFETAQTTGIGDIMQRVTQMASNFREFKLDNIEFVCMKIIVLLNPDVVGLTDQPQVEQLQDKFHTALQQYIQSKSLKDCNRFGNILLRLPELRSIGTRSLERLFMLKFTGQIHPGENLSELLHSAKR